MKFYIHKLLVVAVFTLAAIAVSNAQDERPAYYYEELPSFMRPDSTKIKPKRMGQYNDFVNLKTIYPPRPRHKGALEVSGGSYSISGDVSTRGGWNVGLGYRWNIGYVLSMRTNLNYGRTWGQEFDFKTVSGSLQNGFDIRNAAYRRANAESKTNGGTEYRENNNKFVLDNYYNQSLDMSTSFIFNLNNIKYHRKQNKANFYTFFGVGVQMYKTMVDALNEDGVLYDYKNSLWNNAASIFYSGSATSPDREENGSRGFSFSDRREAKTELRDLYGGFRKGDRTYETPAEGMDPDNLKFFNWSRNWTFHAGLGVEFLLTKWLVIGLETKNTWTVGDDLLDGQRWSDQGDLTRRFDNFNQTNLKFAFNLGSNQKRELPMWWRNPHDPIYDRLTNQPDMTEVSNTLESISNDSDDDGIPNAFDIEPSTPKGAVVDSRGRTLDSDGDGCPDHLDPEPYSTPLLPMVDCKNVYDFAAKECCDEKEALIAKRKQDCEETKMPSVKFDSDKYYISPSELSNLLEIAKKMQDCPDIRVVVRAISADKNDVKYNEQISWNRANATVNHLVEKYGISRDRFIIEFVGEKKQNKEIRGIDFDAAIEGQTGSSNPPAPHPGIKAGSDK